MLWQYHELGLTLAAQATPCRVKGEPFVFPVLDAAEMDGRRGRAMTGSRDIEVITDTDTDTDTGTGKSRDAGLTGIRHTPDAFIALLARYRTAKLIP